MEECRRQFDIEEEYATNVNLKREEVKLLREWIKNQGKYPEVSDIELFLCFHSCYYDIERTKNTIDCYYVQRANWPEVFKNRNPNSPSFQLHLNVAVHFPLKQQTKERYRIMYAKLVDCNSSNFDFEQQIKLFFAVAELWLRTATNSEGFVVVLDALGISWGHLPKFGLSQARKLVVYLQDAFPIRLKGVHIININPIVEKIVQILRMFMNKELQELTHVYSGFNNLDKYIPLTSLPKDYGGDDDTIIELHKNMLETLQRNAYYFEKDDEVLEPKPKGKFSFLSNLY